MKLKPKFKYGDEIKIINGFYKGQTGEICNHNGIIFKKYRILLKVEKIRWIKEKYLELKK